MITEVKLTNFKCFKNETVFPLAKINLLTGINGKGKSSFLQSLLLIKQTIEQNPTANYLILNGSCIHLGGRDDVKNTNSLADEPICFEFLHKAVQPERETLIGDMIEEQIFTHNHRYHFSITDDKLLIDSCDSEIKGEDGNIRDNKSSKIDISDGIIGSYYNEETTSNKGLSNELTISNHTYKDMAFSYLIPGLEGRITHFLRNEPLSIYYINYRFVFISADRIGPKDFYLRSNNEEDVEKNGSNTVNVLSKNKDAVVNDALYRGNNAQTLLDQTGEWLSYIFDTPNISVKLHEDSPFSITMYFSINTTSFLPSNVGFGYSYVLPIIVAGLLAEQKNQALIIENPEAHLHPRAQSRLTEFLAIVASCGVQIFIESHSEHILNGLRIAALNPQININNTDISVLYFDDKTTQPTQIPIEPDGGISLWPNGFFDQNDNDYKILFGL